MQPQEKPSGAFFICRPVTLQEWAALKPKDRHPNAMTDAWESEKKEETPHD